MQFEALPPLPLAVCSTCHASGVVGWRSCRACAGMAIGHKARGNWLYWNYPLERYNIALQNVRRIFNTVRWITSLLLGINCLVWAAWYAYRAGGAAKLQGVLNGNYAQLTFPPSAQLLFWCAALFFCYTWYRSIAEKKVRGSVEHFNYNNAQPVVLAGPEPSWSDVKKMKRSARLNVATTFTDESLQALEAAYRLADKNGYNRVTLYHVFASLLTFNRIGNIFTRLGIPVSLLQKKVVPLLGKNNTTTGGTHTAPVVGSDIAQLLFHAYETAYQAHQEYVSVTELVLCVVELSPELQEILYDVEIDKQKLINVVEWARIREALQRQYTALRKAARHRSKHGMDRAMTAVATPFLNQYSDDLTLLAQFGHTETCVSREKEIEEIFRVVEGGQENVILVGDYGVGKRSIVEGIAEKMVQDDVPNRLKDKRMVRLSISSLVAGTTPAGAVERLIHIMNEIGRARNIILFIHNIHELMGVSAGEGQSVDVASTLAEYISGGAFLTIATTTTEAYAQHINNSKLSSIFSKVDVAEMDENQAIQVLESRVGYVEYKHNVFFSYGAIEKAVQFAHHYVHEVYLPGSALEVMSEAASLTKQQKGANSLVTHEEVAAVVAQKTKIPVNTVTSDETSKLLHLEEVMHERVVGQEEAVTLVANALRRARADIRSQARPIANFLFLGPTGVGKTELAKTIAEVYFGGENRMVRLDMSEYQDTNSIYRLIGAAGQKGSGILTEAIRRSPFALLLLDEIEKADKDILNLFLQVMDDGRLTDSTGHVIDFTNVIIIATSNAGTQAVQDHMREGLTSEVIKDRLLHGELKDYFRPEFLNRFDGIVLFKALNQEAIKKIAGLMLRRVAKDLDNKGITMHITDSAMEYLASVGFDPEFGARPMRRVLQEKVENPLAELLLSKQLQRRDTITVGDEAKLVVSGKS